MPGKDFFFVDFPHRTWVDAAEGHILVGRGNEVMWRSARAYPVASAKDDLAAMLVGVPGIAFQLDERGLLYVAAGRGPEHPVTAGEWPEAWTRSGDLITIHAGTEDGHDWAIFLRLADGSFVRSLAEGLTVRAIDARAVDSNGWFWFWTAAGNLVRTDGAAERAVSNYLALGFADPPSIYPLEGGLMNLFGDDWHAVIVHRDGTVFARASAPTDGSVAGFGSQLASPDGRVVVYALASLIPPRGTTVFALHQGDASGRPIFHTREVDWVCAFPPYAWGHSRLLLFRYSDGRAVAIDTSGRHEPLPVDERTARRVFGSNRGRLEGAP